MPGIAWKRAVSSSAIARRRSAGGRAGDDRERDLRADAVHGQQVREELAARRHRRSRRAAARPRGRAGTSRRRPRRRPPRAAAPTASPRRGSRRRRRRATSPSGVRPAATPRRRAINDVLPRRVMRATLRGAADVSRQSAGPGAGVEIARLAREDRSPAPCAAASVARGGSDPELERAPARTSAYAGAGPPATSARAARLRTRERAAATPGGGANARRRDAAEARRELVRRRAQTTPRNVLGQQPRRACAARLPLDDPDRRIERRCRGSVSRRPADARRHARTAGSATTRNGSCGHGVAERVGLRRRRRPGRPAASSRRQSPGPGSTGARRDAPARAEARS